MNDHSFSAQIATLYRFCAQSMQFPEPAWFTSEYLASLHLLLNALGAENEGREIRAAMAEPGDGLEKLQIEYTRLFINGVPHVAAPPYGSVYLDKSLQGQHAAKTLQFYREHGFLLKENADLPDHLAHQLEVLALLAEQGNAEAETDFLNSLFIPWFPHFKQRVEQEAQQPFYPVIVQLIDFFTMEENNNGI